MQTQLNVNEEILVTKQGLCEPEHHCAVSSFGKEFVRTCDLTVGG